MSIDAVTFLWPSILWKKVFTEKKSKLYRFIMGFTAFDRKLVVFYGLCTRLNTVIFSYPVAERLKNEHTFSFPIT